MSVRIRTAGIQPAPDVGGGGSQSVLNGSPLRPRTSCPGLSRRPAFPPCARKGGALLAEVGRRGRSRGVDDTRVRETASFSFGSASLSSIKAAAVAPPFRGISGAASFQSDGLSDGEIMTKSRL